MPTTTITSKGRVTIPKKIREELNLQPGDIFLFASKSETQGMVILEAIAAGLPVVAVNATGIDDVVQEGENGYKTLEIKEFWMQKVKLLFEDAELREELSQNALSFAKSYSIEAFASKVQHIYATILAAYNEKS